MKSMNRRKLMELSAVSAGLSVLGSGAAWAQSAHPLSQSKVITGFPAGDMIDTIARSFAEKLKGSFAEIVLVDNKPGAGGRIGVTAMKGLPADGSNLLFTPAPMIVLYPHVFKSLSYDPLKDVTPVARTAVACYALSVGPAVPASVTTLAQFLDWCRANPKQASYGTSGVGTSIHLTGANLARLSGVPLTMIPYKGGSLAANDLIAGQVPAVMSTVPSVMEFVKAGKARFLAVSSAQRWPGLPDVPTFAESGFPQLTGLDWFGVFLPANAPRDLVQRLHAIVVRAAQAPDLVAALGKLGIQMMPSNSAEEFAEQVRAEYAKWRDVVKAVNFTPQD
jgi:tripartite-type tricarboxylate transporter receptor subunit TctC